MFSISENQFLFFKFRANAVRWGRSGVVGDGDVFVFHPHSSAVLLMPIPTPAAASCCLELEAIFLPLPLKCCTCRCCHYTELSVSSVLEFLLFLPLPPCIAYLLLYNKHEVYWFKTTIILDVVVHTCNPRS